MRSSIERLLKVVSVVLFTFNFVISEGSCCSKRCFCKALLRAVDPESADELEKIEKVNEMIDKYFDESNELRPFEGEEVEIDKGKAKLFTSVPFKEFEEANEQYKKGDKGDFIKLRESLGFKAEWGGLENLMLNGLCTKVIYADSYSDEGFYTNKKIKSIKGWECVGGYGYDIKKDDWVTISILDKDHKYDRDAGEYRVFYRGKFYVFLKKKDWK